MAPPLIQTQQIVKRFGALVANDHVDLTVAEAEVHALLGENGAGKSTLVKMLYGLLQPDAGRILWRGEPLSLAGPRAARHVGIGMVFQHFSLFDALTVAENVALGLDGQEPLPRIADRLAEGALPACVRTRWGTIEKLRQEALFSTAGPGGA